MHRLYTDHMSVQAGPDIYKGQLTWQPVWARQSHWHESGSRSFLSDPSRFLNNLAMRLSSYVEALPDAESANDRDEAGARSFLLDTFKSLSNLALRLPAYVEALPDAASANAVTEVQRDIESLVARIVPVDFYPPSWEGRISELWNASRQLDETTGRTPADQWHVIAKVHAYTAGMTADFAHFVERRRQRSSQQCTQQQVQQQQQQCQFRLPAHRHGLEPLLEPLQEMLQLMEQLTEQLRRQA